MAVEGNFDVRTERLNGALVVIPSGEIDLATAGLVGEAVERDHDGAQDLVLDLRGVQFLDTSGLRLVLALNERAEREGFGIRLVRGPRAVQRVFEVSGLGPRLPFVDDPAEVPGDT